MAFYDLSKEERIALSAQIHSDLLSCLQTDSLESLSPILYFSNQDTYIRKTAYISLGRIYERSEELRPKLLSTLAALFFNEDPKVRQTIINTAGEIGKRDFNPVVYFFDKGLIDPHASVRNAVIGSIKKMSEANPKPTLAWAQQYLQHPDKEIRREICHGIELRGRTHPQDILPMLVQLQNDPTSRVRTTLVHVLGQISYKKGCLATVVAALKSWDNPSLVAAALKEIIDVHKRYREFAILSPEEAEVYISENFKRL